MRRIRAASPQVISSRVHDARLKSEQVEVATHGPARRQRHQDPRSPWLEWGARTALHGLVVLAETASLPQSEENPVALASDRPAEQREHAAVVSRHQSARAGAGSGA